LIADTSFLIDIMANEPSAVGKAKEIEGRGLPLFVGSPTVFELCVGVALSGKAEKEKIKIVSIITSLPQLSLDFKSACAGGTIYGDKFKTGSEIDVEDAMLAGIAKIRGEPILTRNIKHFSGIEGVTIEHY
jgi:predicted nucleic acid-binding protein